MDGYMVPPPPLYASPRYSAIVHAASAAVLPQPSEVPTWAQQLWTLRHSLASPLTTKKTVELELGFSFFYVNYIRMN
jgi:hypothetical protein